ncbi:acyl-CoA thioesterase [Micromonospora sp. WMMD980]|uniref:acyl-CoA thioesterase n=1 Tax=Micromonospora sp. WMMD980 TaxID=3016088 RepID=UPI002416C6CB|nr:acyl-CoA thioesterase [Micromonospora sp. WMMD980]MDG4800693.1 acyl-CoA thioesterase [Micromonospora sp. WMMD980]
MADPFRVRVTVRGYELDTQGHLNQAVYLQYAEHARWECLRAAGIAQDRLLAAGVGPVALEVTVRYLRELRGGDEVDVTCEFRWGEGRTFGIVQDFTRPDGTPVAAVTGVGGLLDLAARRLVPEPGERLRALAVDPAPMSL